MVNESEMFHYLVIPLCVRCDKHLALTVISAVFFEKDATVPFPNFGLDPVLADATNSGGVLKLAMGHNLLLKKTDCPFPGRTC